MGDKLEEFYAMAGIDMQVIYDSNVYATYLRTVNSFNGNKEDIINILEQYGEEIIEFIMNNDEFKDFILQEKRTIRHDLEFTEEVNIQKVMQDILGDLQSLNNFEQRAKIVVFSEIANLINTYGMQQLKSSHELVAKEMRFGVFFEKNNFWSHESREELDRRMQIGEQFGKEAIPYFKNLDLLKERTTSLIEYSQSEGENEELNSLMQQIERIEALKNNEEVIPLLKKAYLSYELMNRKMILSRVGDNVPDIIDNPEDDKLMILHFTSDYSEDSDLYMDEYLDQAVDEAIKWQIERRTGRKFDNDIDGEEYVDWYMQYKDSRKNPFDLESRIPIKGSYQNDSLANVITQPRTILSTSIANIGNLYPHLDRKIAIGFTASAIPIDAIKTINIGYNNELDRFNFERNSASLPQVLSHIENGGTNETLLDWTMIAPSYILLVKYEKELPEKLLAEAQEYHEMTGLPIKIYDSYEIEKGKSLDEKTPKPIEGTYSQNDLRCFAQLQTKRDIIAEIRNIQTKEDKEKTGGEIE